MTDTKKREKARQAPTYTLVGETGHYNFSPVGFRLSANQFYQCRQTFQCPDFSPVPYFLLCRAIELQFKAVHFEQLKGGHLGHQTQDDVKKSYNHNLIKSYPAADRTLSREQLKLLKKAITLTLNYILRKVYVRDGLKWGTTDFTDLTDRHADAQAPAHEPTTAFFDRTKGKKCLTET